MGAASHLQAQSGDSISILPLGDSLTWGFDGFSADYPNSDTGGYRSTLYSLLTSEGINVTYDGVDHGNPSPVLTAAGQTAQDGFGGYLVSDITNNLDASVASPVSTISNDGGYWLTGGGGTGRGPETPNIILLQIGTNDLADKYDPSFTGTAGTETAAQLASDTAARLGTLISKIQTLEPQATLLVDGAPLMISPPGAIQLSQDYDQDVDSLITSQFQGKKVFYVDVFDEMTPGGNQLFSNADDGVHLNTLGYAVVADTWNTAILDDYVDLQPVPEPSTYALFAGGALALFAWRKFRRAS